MISRRSFSKQWLLTLPSLAWLGLFFVIPAILIVVTAFRPADLHGGVGPGWTMENIGALSDPVWLPIVWRTVALSAATTWRRFQPSISVTDTSACSPRTSLSSTRSAVSPASMS